MSHTTLYVPAPVAMPRGAEWAASAFAAVLNWARDAWESGAARRAQHRRIDEASSLRRVAAGVSWYDPAFAADLFAAADRHLEDNGR